MSEQQNYAVVRAKPGKVSVTETYYYQVELSDYTSMSFQKAEGKIKAA